MDQGKQILQELGLILQAADEMNCNRVLCCIVDQKRNRKTIGTVVTGATGTHKSIVMQPTSSVTL